MEPSTSSNKRKRSLSPVGQISEVPATKIQKLETSRDIVSSNPEALALDAARRARSTLSFPNQGNPYATPTTTQTPYRIGPTIHTSRSFSAHPSITSASEALPYFSNNNITTEDGRTRANRPQVPHIEASSQERSSHPAQGTPRPAHNRMPQVPAQPTSSQGQQHTWMGELRSRATHELMQEKHQLYRRVQDYSFRFSAIYGRLPGFPDFPDHIKADNERWEAIEHELETRPTQTFQENAGFSSSRDLQPSNMPHTSHDIQGTPFPTKPYTSGTSAPATERSSGGAYHGSPSDMWKGASAGRQLPTSANPMFMNTQTIQGSFQTDDASLQTSPTSHTQAPQQPQPESAFASRQGKGRTQPRSSFPPYSHHFRDSADAMEYRKQHSHREIPKHLEGDPTIAYVENNRDEHVRRLYEAMTRGDRALDNDTGNGYLRWVNTPAYEGKMVEAQCHLIFDKLLELVKDGYHGRKEDDRTNASKDNSKRKPQHKKPNPDLNANCSERFELVVEALATEKMICEDVIASEEKITMFVIAPTAYAKRKASNRPGNNEKKKRMERGKTVQAAEAAAARAAQGHQVSTAASAQTLSVAENTSHYQLPVIPPHQHAVSEQPLPSDQESLFARQFQGTPHGIHMPHISGNLGHFPYSEGGGHPAHSRRQHVDQQFPTSFDPSSGTSRPDRHPGQESASLPFQGYDRLNPVYTEQGNYDDAGAASPGDQAWSQDLPLYELEDDWGPWLDIAHDDENNAEFFAPHSGQPRNGADNEP